MSTPTHRARQTTRGHLNLLPSGWATPATSHGRLAVGTVAEITAALLPSPHPPAQARSTLQADLGRRMSPQVPPVASSSRTRLSDENAGFGQSYVNMDIDLPIEYPPAARRTLQPYGLPLQALDLNRVRFPNAFQRMGPLPEDESGGNRDGSTEDDDGNDAYQPRGILSVRDRVPTPHPGPSSSQDENATPARVVSHSAAALAAAFTPSQPIPIPAGPEQPRGPVVGTATYNAAMHPHLYSVPLSSPFTSVPPGGFPVVHLADPDGLFRGLSRARGVALREEKSCFIARLHNFDSSSQHELRQATTIVANIVTQASGEANPLVVAPERDSTNGPPSRLGPNPLSFAVIGISAEAVLRMLRQSAWSTLIGTIHVFRAVIEPTPFMFVAGGFAHDHNGCILNAIFAVFSGPDVLPYTTQLVQSHPDFVGVPPEDAARTILASLVVRVSTLQNGNLQAAVFCTPPTLTASRWVEWRGRVASRPFPHPLNSTGFARRQAPCAGCHGEDHPTHLCPFPSVPGWNAPAPGTTWGQAGLAFGNGAQPPPPPPPPPAAGGFASRGRSQSTRKGANSSMFNGHRRDQQGGGPGAGSGAGPSNGRSTGFGGNGYDDGAGQMTF